MTFKMRKLHAFNITLNRILMGYEFHFNNAKLYKSNKIILSTKYRQDRYDIINRYLTIMSKDMENQCRVRTITVILASVMCFQDDENLVRMTGTRFFFFYIYRRGPIIFSSVLNYSFFQPPNSYCQSR